MAKNPETADKPRIAFFGTSIFSVYILDGLLEHGITPDLIITTPDKPQGRKLLITPCPAKEWALEHDIPVISPEKIRDLAVQDQLRAGEFDLFIVASYGKILPTEILDMPRRKTLNVHPSLLPLFRGPSPIESAILHNPTVGNDPENIHDQKKTGVSIMELDAEMDHGPILVQSVYITPDWPSRETLERELGALGAKLLAEIIPHWVAGKVEAEAQEHDRATYTKKITKDEALIDFTLPHAYEGVQGYTNFLKIQAYAGWPQAYAFFEKKTGLAKGEDYTKVRIVIKEAEWDKATEKLTITRVVPEGKKEMSFEEFKRGL